MLIKHTLTINLNLLVCTNDLCISMLKYLDAFNSKIYRLNDSGHRKRPSCRGIYHRGFGTTLSENLYNTQVTAPLRSPLTVSP